MTDQFQEDLFGEPPSWLVFHHLQSHSLWEPSRTHFSWGLLYRVPCWSDQFAMQNARGLGWDQSMIQRSVSHLWRFRTASWQIWADVPSGCARNKTDFYGLHGHSFVLTSMDWSDGLRCWCEGSNYRCWCEGSNYIKSHGAWWDTTGADFHESLILMENKYGRLLHELTWCCSLHIIMSQDQSSYAELICIRKTTLLFEGKVQDIQNALATRGMTARCSVSIHHCMHL